MTTRTRGERDVRDDPTAQHEVPDEPDAARRSTTWPPHRAIAFPVGLAVVALLLATLVTVLGVRLATGSGSDEPALVAARQTATDLLTIDPATADDTLQRLTDGATGEFAGQLDARSGNFAGAIRESEVSSTGTVSAAGVSERGPGRAVVLVAAESTVQNAQVPDGEQRQYRMRLTVEEDGGRWLVSRLEFVP